MGDRQCDIRGCVGVAAHRYVLPPDGGEPVEWVELCGWHEQVTTRPAETTEGVT